MNRVLTTIAFGCLVCVSCVTSSIRKSQGQTEFEVLAQRADHLTIRTGGLCHRKPDREINLLSTANRTEIASWTSAICIAEDRSIVTNGPGQVDVVTLKDGTVATIFTKSPTIIRGNCGCCGDYTFEYFQGTNLCVALSLHHMRHIRSAFIYQGHDADLTPQSMNDLNVKIEELRKCVGEKTLLDPR